MGFVVFLRVRLGGRGGYNKRKIGRLNETLKKLVTRLRTFRNVFTSDLM